MSCEYCGIDVVKPEVRFAHERCNACLISHAVDTRAAGPVGGGRRVSRVSPTIVGAASYHRPAGRTTALFGPHGSEGMFPWTALLRADPACPGALALFLGPRDGGRSKM